MTEETEKSVLRLNFTKLPQIEGEREIYETKIQEIEEEVNNFKDITRRAKYPFIGCCGKRHSCCCCFREVFGSLIQQRYLLERNYMGHHFKV
jgi:hypothetical protein